MATLEHVEKLRQRANVSYEEAKEALEAAGDDLLDAMIYLENKGKVAPPTGGGSYSSEAPRQEAEAAAESFRQEAQKSGESFSQLMGRFFRWCRDMINKGNRNSFEVWRHDEYSFGVPVTVLVVLVLCAFWVVIPLLVVGLFLGFRYRFSGSDLKEDTVVNRAMDGAAQAAENLKEEICTPKSDETKE